MRHARLVEAQAALLGDRRERAARVTRALGALDQALVLEPRDEPAQPAAAEEHGVGERGHSQPALGRLVELDEDVIRADRQAVLPRQLLVELAHQVRVRAQEEAAPRVELELGEGGRLWRVGIRSLHTQSVYRLVRIHASGRGTRAVGHDVAAGRAQLARRARAASTSA